MKVLTIDDDPSVRQSISAYLKDADFKVLEASDGNQGLALLRQEQPNIVICDLYLPDISGLRVLSSAHQEFPNIPIIMISGANIVADVVEALRLGAWDYLVKPIIDLAVMEHLFSKPLPAAEMAEKLKQRKYMNRDSVLQTTDQLTDKKAKASA